MAVQKEAGGTCHGVPEATELIAKYKTDRNDILRRSFELEILAAVSWNFSDGLLRIKLVQYDDSLWINLLDLQSLEVVLETVCHYFLSSLGLQGGVFA